MRSEVQILSPRPDRPSVRADDAGPEGRVPAAGLRLGGQREGVVGHPQDVDPLEHGLRDRVPPGVRGLRPQVRQRLAGTPVPRPPSGCVTGGPPPPAASASRRAIVASSLPEVAILGEPQRRLVALPVDPCLARSSPPSGSGRLASGDGVDLEPARHRDVLERLPDRVLVHVDRVRLAPHPRVDRRPVALDAARGRGLERLAGVQMAVAPDVPGQPAPAGRAGQEPGEAVLAAVDRRRGAAGCTGRASPGRAPRSRGRRAAPRADGSPVRRRPT